MFDAKNALIIKNITGVDNKVDAIIAASDPVLTSLYEKALVINKSPLKKGYVEASLLCETDLAKISIVLDVPVEVLDFYKEFFFEVTGLDKLSKIEHIESIEDDQEKMLKLWALGQGISFLSWRLGNKVTLSPIDGLVELYSTASYKAKEAMYSSNASESSKEALRWTKMSADLARLLKLWTLDSAAAKKELELAIKDVIPDFAGLDALLDENKGK